MLAQRKGKQVVEFNKAELAGFYEQVFVNVAARLNIEDAEWKSRGELEIEIRNSHEEIHALLKQFILIYQAWYDFSFVDGVGKKLEGGESEQYSVLSQARDESRKALLEALSNEGKR